MEGKRRKGYSGKGGERGATEVKTLKPAVCGGE